MSKVVYDMTPYVEARKLFVAWCRELEGALPVEFGSVRSPGLSDLDLAVVFPQGMEPEPGAMTAHLARLPTPVRSVMNGGTLMLFREQDFSKVLFVDDITTTFHGRKIVMEEPESAQLKYINMLQVIEWLPERIAKIYGELGSVQPNTIRLVGFLYSACYSMDKVLQFTGSDPHISSLVAEVRSLRDAWLEMDPDERSEWLEDLAHRSIQISARALERFTTPLEKIFDLDPLRNSSYNLYGDVHLCASEVPGISESGSRLEIRVPPGFLVSYATYSERGSALGRIIRGRFKAGGMPFTQDETLKEVLEIRAKLLFSMYDFVRKLEVDSGLYKFGWYLKEEA